MSRFVILNTDIYDLSDGTLKCEPIGSIGGRRIFPAEALLEEIEGLTGPRVIYPIEHDADIIARARWFE